MPYADRPAQSAPHRGRYTATAKAAAAQVRARAQAGEPCWFYRQTHYEDCPGGWNWQLPANHRWAYTTHHLHRLMDGGTPDPDPAQMAPAHRGCNARDGLRAQNARRAGMHLPTVTHSEGDRTSRAW